MTFSLPRISTAPRLGRTPEIRLLLLLATLVALGFWQLPWLDFVHFDDDTYVVRNPAVLQGLGLDTLAWAFTTFHGCNYHPLTWLSHLADVTLFGLAPAGHHLSSGILHLANALLVYLFFLRATRRVWPSFFLAALWALHPLRVESVAWVAERKDVLSGFFWFAAMHCHLYYSRRPSARRYALLVAGFALGLLAKPMLVTLPLALLLLDVWPLRRFTWLSTAQNAPHDDIPRCPPQTLRRLLAEKLPLLALAGASSAVTLLAQQEAMGGFELYPMGMRVMNALTSYVAYVGNFFWPAGLVVHYPHPGPEQSWALAGLAGLGLALATVAALRRVRSWGFVQTGWFWFLLTLAPVIGLVQVGPQAMADRYTYIPHIGLSLIAVWGAVALCDLRANLRRPLALAGAIALCFLLWRTQIQVAYWRDSLTLFTRAATVEPSDLAFNNLGNAYALAGDFERAINNYQRTLAINPNHSMATANLGLLYAHLGQTKSAEEMLRRATALDPSLPQVYVALGRLALERQDTAQALESFQTALTLAPNNASARSGIAECFEIIERSKSAPREKRATEHR